MSAKLEVGSRITVTALAGKKGEVKFIGKTRFAEGDWVGVRLDTPDGKNDGTVGDVRYFVCEPQHGLFVKSAQVKLDKESVLTDTNSKLAALRERRKLREEESGASAPAAPSKEVKPAIASSSRLLSSSSSLAARRASLDPTAKPSVASTAASRLAERAAAKASSSSSASASPRAVSAAPVSAAAAAVNQDVVNSGPQPTEEEEVEEAEAEAEEQETEKDSPAAEEVIDVDAGTDVCDPVSTGECLKEEEEEEVAEEAPESLTSAPTTVPVSIPASVPILHPVVENVSSSFPPASSFVSSEIGTIAAASTATPPAADTAASGEEEALRGELRDLQEQFDAYKAMHEETVESVERENCRLTVAVQESDHRVNDLQQRLADLEKVKAAAEKEVIKMREEMRVAERNQEQVEASLQTEVQALRSQVSSLQKDLSRSEASVASLEARCVEVSQNLTQAKDSAATTERLADLEAQVSELSDAVEMVTLDKEQLVLEKEILEESVRQLSDELKAHLAGVHSSSDAVSVSVGGGGDGEVDTKALVDENAKLREALRRLHQMGTAESETLRQQLEAALEASIQNEELAGQAEELQAKLAQANEQVSELQQSVDAGQAFERMIESLSERNLELSARVEELTAASEEFESEQELMEELDERQRQEIESLRRDLDSLNVSLQDSEQRNKSMKDRLEDSKRVEDKYKRTMESLRLEISSLQSSLSSTQEQLQLQEHRAREASNFRLSKASQEVELLTLRASLKAAVSNHSEAKAQNTRLEAIFGQCSIYINEAPQLAQDVKLITLASAASAMCELSRRQFEVNEEGFKVATASASASAAASASSAVTEPKVAHLICSEQTIQLNLMALRSACLSWHVSASSVFASKSSELSVVAQASSSCLVNSGLLSTLLGIQSWAESDAFVSPEVVMNTCKQLREVLTQVEAFVFDSMERCGADGSLTRLTRDSSVRPTEASLEPLNLFHSLVQISYYRHAIRMTAMWLASFAVSKSATDAEASSTAGFVALAECISSDLDLLDTAVAGTLKNVIDGSVSPMDIVVSCRNSLRRSLAHLMPFTLQEATPVEGLAAVEAALRQSMLLVREASAAIKAGGSHQMQVEAGGDSVLNIVSDEALLWSWLSVSSVDSPLPRCVPHAQLLSPSWTERAEASSRKVAEWDQSDGLVAELADKARRAEVEAVKLGEQLRSAINRCEELEQDVKRASETAKLQAISTTSTLQNAEKEEKLALEIKMLTEAIDVLEKGQAALEKENKSLRMAARGGPVPPTPKAASSAGFKAQTELSWEALLQQGPSLPSANSAAATSFLGGATGSLASQNATVQSLLQQLRYWKQLASERLMASLEPLPPLPCMLLPDCSMDKAVSDAQASRPALPAELTLLCDELGHANGGSQSDGAPPVPRAIAAQKLYKDIRLIRASVQAVNLKDKDRAVRYGLLHKENLTLTCNLDGSSKAAPISLRSVDDYARALALVQSPRYSVAYGCSRQTTAVSLATKHSTCKTPVRMLEVST